MVTRRHSDRVHLPRAHQALLDGDDDRARPPRHIDGLLSCLDGEGWIADRPRSVFVVPADGSGEPRIVAGGPFEHASPVWSPDGRTLAVVAARGKDRDLEFVNDVYLVRPRRRGQRAAAAHEPRPLTRLPVVQPGRHADRHARGGRADRRRSAV